MEEKKIRSFIPKALRPDVRGSFYSIDSDPEKSRAEIKTIEDLTLERIMGLKDRSRTILHLFKTISCFDNPELEYIENLRSCLVREKKNERN